MAHSHTSSSLCWDRHRIDGKINSSFLLARLFAFMDVYGTFFFFNWTLNMFFGCLTNFWENSETVFLNFTIFFAVCVFFFKSRV